MKSALQSSYCHNIYINTLTIHCWHAQLYLRPLAAFLFNIVSLSILASKFHFLFSAEAVKRINIVFMIEHYDREACKRLVRVHAGYTYTNILAMSRVVQGHV
jgi:hypothetical protein